jgi:predicted ATPase
LTKFVGREAELAHLRRALELAREGHGQIVAAMGEPGVGKSRLFFYAILEPEARIAALRMGLDRGAGLVSR